MKRLPLLFIVASLFAINGCAPQVQYTDPADRATAAPQEAEKPKTQPVFTARDLKIQPQNKPLKKYNGLSLREARQSQSAAQRGQSNSSGTIKSGSAYLSRNPM